MNNMEIALARPCDIDCWMALVEQVKDAFPGLETQEALAEHRGTVLDFMRRGGAICAKVNGKIAGALLFSREDSVLCFLAVDPACRRQHIAEKLVRCMFTFLDANRDVRVTTYREGAPEIYNVHTMEDAVALAREKAQRGDIVSLCPAATGFDMYKSFAERGDLFRSVVQGLR